MLKKIKKLKNAGIFQNYIASADLQDFSTFNLVYGWNGSGKTTLTRLLNTLETKSADLSFPDSEFEITLDDGSTIKHNTLQSFKTRVFVFNQPFIEDNIDWKKQGAKSIVVIAEDKIEERKRFFEVKDVLIPQKQLAHDSAIAVHRASLKERDDFLSNQARSVKQSFQLIDTKDRRYLNYDRTKLRDFIRDNSDEIKKKESVLTAEQIEDLKQKVRPIQRPSIDFNYPQIKTLKIEEGQDRIETLLRKSVTNKIIQHLQENTSINKWVEEGLEIHKEQECKACEFCGQELPAARLSELENHFNQEYKDMMDKLGAAGEWLGNIQVTVTNPDSGDLYEEMQQAYKESALKVADAEELLVKHLIALGEVLQEKIDNPFLTTLTPPAGLENLIIKLEEARASLIDIIEQHNKKTNNFEAELNTHKSKLELHYVAGAVQEKKYFDLIDRITVEEVKVTKYTGELEVLLGEKTILEASLANVAKGAEDFNKALHSFLGRDDISLDYDSGLKGYKIMRKGTAKPASNLSEGEKTAIAFVYFITKLKENGNKVENSIVIVDDPISSFDANHLFHSMSFLKSSCEKAKQLFVLTHNFQYFKMVRDWIMNKNKPGKIKSCTYSIEMEKGVRNAGLNNAHVSLINHGSEYHFLFKKLYEFREDASLNVDSSYQVANYARKLLEGFFTFKLPRGRKYFSQLMDEGCVMGEVEAEVKDKVYRFINKYSHHQVIDFHDSPVDNLLGEGDNITALVLDILKKCDKVHYNEMEAMCQN